MYKSISSISFNLLNNNKKKILNKLNRNIEIFKSFKTNSQSKPKKKIKNS